MTSNNIRKFCMCCLNKNLVEILDLGSHSFADRFIPKKFINKQEDKYPLILQLCKKCKFIQSKIITKPSERYSVFEYSYTSSNSNYAKNHWKKFSNFLEKKIQIKNKKIIEIGSNDGFLSNILREKGAKVLCVDASKFMTNLSKKKKLKSINLVFDYKNSKKIKKNFGIADIIIANNVFNHSNNPVDFIEGIKNLLDDKKGIFIFEQPNFFTGVMMDKYDQIYHEHISYFTATNIKNFIELNGLSVIEMTKNPYHGGSLRTIASISRKQSPKNFFKYLKEEKQNKIYNISFYKKMMKRISLKKNVINDKISQFKEKGYKVVGIGAGAKCNTFLTFNELNNKKIDFITDSSVFKQDKYTPITKIVIKDDQELKKFQKVACIILIWNISKFVIKKIKSLNKNIKFIKI